MGPRYLQVTHRVLRSLQDSYRLGEHGEVFKYRPPGLVPTAKGKVTVASLRERWGKKEARLKIPPLDIVIQWKLEIFQP